MNFQTKGEGEKTNTARMTASAMWQVDRSTTLMDGVHQGKCVRKRQLSIVPRNEGMLGGGGDESKRSTEKEQDLSEKSALYIASLCLSLAISQDDAFSSPLQILHSFIHVHRYNISIRLRLSLRSSICSHTFCTHSPAFSIALTSIHYFILTPTPYPPLLSPLILVLGPWRLLTFRWPFVIFLGPVFPATAAAAVVSDEMSFKMINRPLSGCSFGTIFLFLRR